MSGHTYEASPEVVPPPYKACPACQTGYTRVSWEGLPLTGRQSFDDGEVLELRNCACGSTIAVQLQPPRT
jgi:hypothetical protein